MEEEFAGQITCVQPTEFDYGKSVILKVDFKAYCENLLYQEAGWQTRIMCQLDSLHDLDTQLHHSRIGSQTGKTLNLGSMPNHNISGVLVLEAKEAGLPLGEWLELDRVPLTIQVLEVEIYACLHCPATFSTQADLNTHLAVHPEVSSPVQTEEKKVPWLPILLGAGALVLIVAIASTGEKEKVEAEEEKPEAEKEEEEKND